MELIECKWPRAMRVKRSDTDAWRGEIIFARMPGDHELEALSEFLRRFHNGGALVPALTPADERNESNG